ncbi:MAG: CvpA family protein [Turicibacter sp.]|nr:CvpA family protein [Turicibacter sp.]
MLDLIVFAWFGLFMYVGYKRGLIETLFNFVSLILAIVLSAVLYPIVAGMLRQTVIFDALRDYIMRTMGLEEIVNVHATERIANLPVPELLRNVLLASYQNSDVYGAFGIGIIEAYIADFFAGLAMNILAIVFVFVLVKVALAILSNVLDLVERLPIIRTFNRGGGVLIGFFRCVLVLWVAFAVITLFFLNPAVATIMDMLENSIIAIWFYNNNPIISVLANIT